MPAGLIYISLQNVKWSLLFKFLFLLFFCFIVSLSTCICDSWNIGIATKKEQKQKYFQFRAFKLIQTLSLAPDKTTICERISQFIVTRFARLILISCVECYSFRNHIYNVLIIGFLHFILCKLIPQPKNVKTSFHKYHTSWTKVYEMAKNAMCL